MKIFIALAFIFSFCTCKKEKSSNSLAISCLDEDGNAVESWTAIKASNS